MINVLRKSDDFYYFKTIVANSIYGPIDSEVEPITPRRAESRVSSLPTSRECSSRESTLSLDASQDENAITSEGTTEGCVDSADHHEDEYFSLWPGGFHMSKMQAFVLALAALAAAVQYLYTAFLFLVAAVAPWWPKRDGEDSSLDREYTPEPSDTPIIPSPPSAAKVSMPKFRIRDASLRDGKTRHVVYTIRSYGIYEVERSYVDFEKLRSDLVDAIKTRSTLPGFSQLSGACGGYLGLHLPTNWLPPLPKKFVFQQFDHNKLDRRRLKLESWVRVVLSPKYINDQTPNAAHAI